jgi:hypothetical protein
MQIICSRERARGTEEGGRDGRIKSQGYRVGMDE